jgi:UDP-glucose:(heptosyl)LPS alpha-1,3-glucosyltransferase
VRNYAGQPVGPRLFMPRPRIAVVSPFIDKRHGTERRVAECVQRLSRDYEIHIYSNRAEDVDLDKITWHRVPALPGPHLFAYLWWFLANHLWRWRDRRFRGLAPEVVYSPGVNCLDADAISVHVVFARLRESVASEVRLSRNPVKTWPQLIHRRIYYRLIRFLESRVYLRPDTPLAVVSRKVASDLSHYFGRVDNVRVVYGGLDLSRFNPERRASLRPGARANLSLDENDFALLLVGNGWKNKGLPSLLESVGMLQDPRLTVLVAGQDNPAPYHAAIERHHLSGRVRFLQPRPDVEFFYAAADAYVGPSLEDAFAQPPAEAMASGLPVITSRRNGGAEIISHGSDGLILEDPADVGTLAEYIHRVIDDADFRWALGANAARTAEKFTWENNAAEMKALFELARLGRSEKHAEHREGAALKK